MVTLHVRVLTRYCSFSIFLCPILNHSQIILIGMLYIQPIAIFYEKGAPPTLLQKQTNKQTNKQKQNKTQKQTKQQQQHQQEETFWLINYAAKSGPFGR